MNLTTHIRFYVAISVLFAHSTANAYSYIYIGHSCFSPDSSIHLQIEPGNRESGPSARPAKAKVDYRQENGTYLHKRSFDLLNPEGPDIAVVNSLAEILTVDDIDQWGYGERVMVIYDSTGNVKRTFRLEDVIEESFIESYYYEVAGAGREWKSGGRLINDSTYCLDVTLNCANDEAARRTDRVYVNLRSASLDDSSLNQPPKIHKFHEEWSKMSRPGDQMVIGMETTGSQILIVGDESVNHKRTTFLLTTDSCGQNQVWDSYAGLGWASSTKLLAGGSSQTWIGQTRNWGFSDDNPDQHRYGYFFIEQESESKDRKEQFVSAPWRNQLTSAEFIGDECVFFNDVGATAIARFGNVDSTFLWAKTRLRSNSEQYAIRRTQENKSAIYIALVTDGSDIENQRYTETAYDPTVLFSIPDFPFDPSITCVLKLDSNSIRLWQTQILDSFYSEPAYMKVAPDGDVFLAGSYVPLPDDSICHNPNRRDGFVARISNDGKIQWTRRFKGVGDDRFSSLDVTQDGRVLVTGYTTSFGQGLADVLVACYSFSGDLLWSTTLGGDRNDVGAAVCLLRDGRIAISGSTRSGLCDGTDLFVMLLSE